MMDFAEMMKRPLPRTAPEGQTLILVLPDGSIRPVPNVWLGTDEDEFDGLRAAERETGGTLVYVPEMQVEGVPIWTLPTYQNGQLVPADPNSLLAQAEWKRIAQEELTRTDYVPARAMESARALSADWIAWREELRETIRGERSGMPRTEPGKWADEPEDVAIPPFLQTVPDELTDLVRENEPYGESRARLWQLYVNLQSRIADNGLSMDLPTPDQYALHSRLSRHLEWLRGTGAVDVI
jgi:hypothetical protein